MTTRPSSPRLVRLPRFALASAAVVLALVACPARAGAEAGGETRAAEVFARGSAQFERRAYREAAASFEEAAALAPHPAPLLNAADAWERAGDLPRAADACDRALALGETTGAFRDVALQRLERLVPKVGTLEVVGPDDVEVQIDGGAEMRPPRRRRLAPGAHRIRVVDRTLQARELSVTVEPGQTRTLDVSPELASLASAPDPGARAASGPRGGPPWPSVLLLGASVVSAGAAGAFGAMTLSAQRAFDGDPSRENADTFYARRTATNVALGGALVLGAAGVVLWVLAPGARAGGGSAARPTAALRVGDFELR